MSVIDVFTALPKSELIKIYRDYCEKKEIFHRRADGIKGTKPRYKRPVINGEVIAWRQFDRLPKEAVIVFVFTEGCDTEYILEYMKERENNE